MKQTFIALLLSFAVTGIKAQQLKFKNGETFTIASHDRTKTLVEEKYNFNISNSYIFQFKVLNSNAAACTLQCVLQKAKAAVDVGSKTHLRLNTDSIKQLNFNSFSFLNPLIVLQKPFTVVLSAKGKLLRVEGYDELINQGIKNWHLVPNRVDWLKDKKNDPVLASLKNIFFQYPEASLSYQSAWKKDTVNYKVVAIRGALLDIQAADDNKTFEAKYTINDSNGLLEEASVINNRANFYNNYTQTMAENTTVAAVDTAWLNMAALMDHISDTFDTPGKKIDHVKALAYFKAHDEQFKGDDYYLIHKLSMLKRLDDGMMAMRAYDAALKETPNSLLVNQPFPLFDKLQLLETQDASAAFDVIKYIYKDQWDDWIQLYARNFTEEKRPVTYELIAKLNADKNMGLQPKLQAMSLWINAKDNAANTAALLKASNAFRHLTEASIKSGDGTRYALLTYKLLDKAGKPKDAEKLLQNTIEKLERYTADTLNKRRFQDNDILTHAYYLKYQALSKTDSVKALQYLAKAAYAPVFKRRKEISELSDLFFLEFKSSYRDEYITKLFANGNTETALDLFVTHISADASKLDDMQKIYESRFKDKSFKEFFNSKVLPSWQNASGFSLVGMNGNVHKLTDYKGKWLVIDFWGTWCPPCREEMPGINTYNDEINAGKHPGISLLSIACNDNLAEVKKYLKDNKFNITAAMGDKILPVQYRIKGYPAKVLISPNGKMIDVTSLADWRAIVDKLNQLYAIN
jgi:thiol-disulfide isomerase/thioredoxin